MTDVEVHVEAEVFQAHKLILTCHSPYFHKLLINTKPEMLKASDAASWLAYSRWRHITQGLICAAQGRLIVTSLAVTESKARCAGYITRLLLRPGTGAHRLAMAP
ncbi:hypothetical protein HPB50_013708 [Hyalomma asiaticum]|uniref:Uncharacterized protein n=1 Tax=Hyalomma asiaticum TaxID=266040 RepID=A0ACB7T2G6_HYAAI|nr:hypothetical protein HPB50_013708 [Hyalomma asiaticum]